MCPTSFQMLLMLLIHGLTLSRKGSKTILIEASIAVVVLPVSISILAQGCHSDPWKQPLKWRELVLVGSASRGTDCLCSDCHFEHVCTENSTGRQRVVSHQSKEKVCLPPSTRDVSSSLIKQSTVSTSITSPFSCHPVGTRAWATSTKMTILWLLL